MHSMLGRDPAEHDIEFGETEDEAVGLVDQRYLGGGAAGGGDPSRQFQSAEARA
jgi:hypothetical protein